MMLHTTRFGLLTLLMFSCPLFAGEAPEMKPPDLKIPRGIVVFGEVDGVIVFEVESAMPAGGSWKAEKQMDGYTGKGYYTWRGKDLFRKPGEGVMSWAIHVKTGGKYHLRIHNRHDFHDSTEQNDCWTRMDNGKWTKTFSPRRGKWTWTTHHEHGHNSKPRASYDLKPGLHRFQISGRSKGFSIDRVHLYVDGAKNPTDTSRDETRMKREASSPQAPDDKAPRPAPVDLVEKPLEAEKGKAAVTGQLKQWHRVTITFDGPDTAENGSPNPFLDARLNVTFERDGRKIVVPGFYAADGNAGETGATAGDKWRVHFTPDEKGEWKYTASFRTGRNIAMVSEPGAGEPTGPDGLTGKFSVGPSDKKGRDFRARGILRYAGKRYLRFAGTGKYYIKGGADSPENFLGYVDFDGTSRLSKAGRGRKGEAAVTRLHKYEPHVKDWREGDPTWKGGRGKGIIGAVNYLAGKGMNSVYFIPYNIDGGDGKDVWPWTSPAERLRYDCSRLDQWEIVFSHMDARGVAMHVITQEQENDQGLDKGNLGRQRAIYYRELVARFGHHPALVWNLGEENTNTDAQRKSFCRYIRKIDPYDHPIVCHTFPGKYDKVYKPLLGFEQFEGPSLQIGNMKGTHRETVKWVERSQKAGRAWFVCLDEIGPAHTGVKPDRDDPSHDGVRKRALWGNLMGGGAGCEWYFGYKFAHNDLNCEDWRSRENMWDQTRHALQFFHKHLPFWEMKPADDLTEDKKDYCLAKAGSVYAIYLPGGGGAKLTIPKGSFSVRWYNPRAGGDLLRGSIDRVKGPGSVSTGNPPADPKKDWVVLVRPAV